MSEPSDIIASDDIATLAALANGIIPADARDAGAAAVNAGERLGEKLAAGANSHLYRSGLESAATIAQTQFGCPVAALDATQMHTLLDLLRNQHGAFFRQLRMDVCAMYLSDPGVWARIGFPGPSTAQGGYPDFDQPQMNMPPSQISIRNAYDLASDAYARKYINELDHKPLDREFLQHFASLVGAGRPVLDVGCGPGHTTAYLSSLGLQATGVDLSPMMVAQASALFLESQFLVGDFFSLPNDSSSIAGILGFYCIVHLTPDQLVPAFAEMFRVLVKGGVLLLSFHVGSEVIHAENFLDTTAVLDFTFFETAPVTQALAKVGFDPIDVRLRLPYPTEYPSERCYIFAHKP